MALNFHLGNNKDWNTISTSPWDPDKMHPVTDCLIWKTIAVDLGEIKESNLDEWWFRVRLLQIIGGPDLRYDKGDVYLTRKDIEMHVGLSTNVSNKSRKDWLARILSHTRFDREKPPQKKSAYEICAELAAGNEKK